MSSDLEMDDRRLLRYSRHIMLPQMDVEGQQALLNASVLVIGAGGLGCPTALYLASSGIGNLHISDFDEVEITNLQRQILHRESSLGQNKCESAKTALTEINSDCRITTYPHKLSEPELNDLVATMDVVVDACDNFETRFLVNRVCYAQKKPLVSGAAIRMEGQLSVFDARRHDSPCYRCLYQDQGELAETCSESGILAPVVGVVGSLQALETVKLLTNIGEPLIGKLLLFDAMQMEWRSLNLKKDPNCPVCGKQNTA